MKNCMEMALLRHEKELSVKEVQKQQEDTMLRETLEKGHKLTQVEK